jgi:hypothetical protein
VAMVRDGVVSSVDLSTVGAPSGAPSGAAAKSVS